jgi:hypothetical protein
VTLIEYRRGRIMQEYRRCGRRSSVDDVRHHLLHKACTQSAGVRRRSKFMGTPSVSRADVRSPDSVTQTAVGICEVTLTQSRHPAPMHPTAAPERHGRSTEKWFARRCGLIEYVSGYGFPWSIVVGLKLSFDGHNCKSVPGCIDHLEGQIVKSRSAYR